MMAFGSHGNDGKDDDEGDDGERSDEGSDESQQTSPFLSSASAENLGRKHSTAMLFALSLRSSVLVVVMTR